VHAAPKGKRPRPQNKRVWASLKKSPEEVIAQAFEEALQRDPGREKRWFALVDGAPSPLKILPRLAKSYGVELTVVLDLIHVSEYLWKASTVFHDQESLESEEWVRHRLTEILRGHSSRVAGGIRRSATRRGLDVEEREAADKCCNYLLNHTPYLRYDQYLARGSPIATGVIEGACRHLVKDRMERTGARWRLKGAEAVLRLRALRSSGDFDEYWRFHEAREYERNH
ncbi:MAG: ISKra4 family transposase, partial [bacterium]|nr:ISKra4 family transposase [bacterium]